MLDPLAFLEQHVFEIVAALLTAAFGAHLVWRNNRKNRYATACGKFRADVLSALVGLYPSPSAWPDQKLAIHEELQRRFPALQLAVAEFRPQLPFWRTRMFDRAWNLYLNGEPTGDGSRLGYWQYVPHSGDGICNGQRFSHDNRLTYQDDFKSNVAGLLSYANET